MKVLLVLCLSVVALAAASPCAAEPVFREPSSRDFVPPPALQGKVEFWVRVFTKFGKDQAVFHYRDYPEIVYSILDFSDLAARFSDRELSRAKARALTEETNRIDAALAWLAAGKAPRNELETRIERIFEGFFGKGSSKYRQAREPDQIRSQTGIRERFSEGVKRAGRYLYLIEQIFEQEGLPWELTRLPYVESSFDYTAYSSVGAAGIWQFMPSTARNYMRVTRYVDERRDPVIATRAATRYLEHAHRVLQRWPLSVTSYNHGINGVLRGVKTTGSYDLATIIAKYRNDSFGFASKNFFASFLAAVEVDRNWRNYFPGLVREEPWYFDEVRLDRSVSFSDLARLTGMGREDLAAHNLALLKPVVENRVPIPSGFVVKVPKGQGNALASRLRGSHMIASLAHGNTQYKEQTLKNSSSSSKQSADAPSRYTVQRGDTIGGIAHKYGVSSGELMAKNGMQDPRKLRAGMKIHIPEGRRSDTKKVPASSTVSRSSAKVESPGTTYRVSKGDTLSTIARKHGTTLVKLRQANPGVSEKIRIGQVLQVP